MPWRAIYPRCEEGKEGRSLLSRTAVSEVTERLWAQYEAFASRDLSVAVSADGGPPAQMTAT